MRSLSLASCRPLAALQIANVLGRAGRIPHVHQLNIRHHVDTTEPVVVMSVEDALAPVREAERRRDEAVAKMNELLEELGYAEG